MRVNITITFAFVLSPVGSVFADAILSMSLSNRYTMGLNERYRGWETIAAPAWDLQVVPGVKDSANSIFNKKAPIWSQNGRNMSYRCNKNT